MMGPVKHDETQLDILLYAHDGRGLGHASRTVAVGMALRRLFPHLKVLLVSGCARTPTLIGAAPLDWIKLPSYATTVAGGLSRGRSGPSNFSDTHLGVMRSDMLQYFVRVFRPRLALVDHSPQGKHGELHAALEASETIGTTWVLGVRAVVGKVDKVWSQDAACLFQQHYRRLFWYGDSSVLGPWTPASLKGHFKVSPLETGYVARLAEAQHWEPVSPPAPAPSGGVVSVSWSDARTFVLLENLRGALERVGQRYGPWRIFADLGQNGPRRRKIMDLFAPLSHCCLEPIGPGLAAALRGARTALVYGGYNSLTDVLAAQLPALVLVRGMQDAEQKEHVERLASAKLPGFEFLDEEQADAPSLACALERLFQGPFPCPRRLNMDGAGFAARHLASLL